MTIAWVLGGRGLLGTALCRALRDDGAELFLPRQRFSWNDPLALAAQMTTAVQEFSLAAQTANRWEIYWAAGVGTMSSTAEALGPETQALSLLLKRLQEEPQLLATSGSLSLASSAGAIYAGSSDEIITEDTKPAPTTAYAHEKLGQEDLVRRFVAKNPGTGALIARISTLYGPGQATGKKQGLLGHIARSILRNQPIQIYVPYDTIRDYIDADDAAQMMICSMRARQHIPCVLTKIIASECPATIAEIVSIFKRLARRSPRIVRSANRLSSLYSPRIQFRSVVASEYPRVPGKRLAVGIAQVMMAERVVFTRGPDNAGVAR